MNVRSALLCFWPVLAAGFAQGGELSGVYVNKNYDYCRIEFLGGGRYFASDPKQEGTYTIDKDTCVCRCGAEEKFHFRRKGSTLVDAEDNVWVPRESLAKMPWKDVSPVTIVVQDRDTRKPISRYAYTYAISTPEAKYDPLWVRPEEVNSPRGEFVVLAPASCEIDVRVEGEGIVGGFHQGGGGYWLTSANQLRRIDVPVATGETVEGVVVDAQTGKPIQGAVVSPVIFCPPLFRANQERGVGTAADGKFVLRGVQHGLGISVWHPDYFEFNRGGFEQIGKKIGEKLSSARIELKAGERLVGAVRDAAGEPLAGVQVSDGAGKTARTNRAGAFVIASPLKWGGNDAYQLSFEKEGYLDKEIHPKAADPKGFSVTLEPQPVLVGQVLGADGRAVESYLVAAAIGREPPAYCCWKSKANVHDPQGRFWLQVDTSHDWDNLGKVWVGVKSPAFALWDTTIDIWKGKTSLAARLAPGVSAHGSVAGRKSLNGTISVTLLPCRTQKQETASSDDLSQRQEMGRLKAAVDADGTFRFDHAAPGNYQLSIAGPAISPIGSAVSVSSEDVDAGEFRPVGRGSLCGMIYEPAMICAGGVCRLDEKRAPWKFVEGVISCPDHTGHGNPDLRFQADEHGRFRVDGVPVGIVTLGIHYHQTADMIGTYARRANVVEGKLTEVRFFDPSGAWDVACKLAVGDGSPAQRATGTGMAAERKVANVTTRLPMFRADLTMKENVPGSFSTAERFEEMKATDQIHLPDVQPGKYRLTVSDWQGSIGLHGVVYDQDIETLKGGTKLTVPLGAGSISGVVRGTKPCRLTIHVIALGKKTGAIRHAYCDEQGNFCARYLPADEYTLVAHDHDAGWCKLAETAVKDITTDIGAHLLAPGGAITGKLPARWATDKLVAVTAVDARGIPIANPNRYEPVGKTFAISNLWPGKWTVKLTKGDRVIVEKAVELRGTETIICDLAEP